MTRKYTFFKRNYAEQSFDRDFVNQVLPYTNGKACMVDTLYWDDQSIAGWLVQENIGE